MGGDKSTSPQGQGRRGHSALGTVAALGVIADPPSPSSPNPSLSREPCKWASAWDPSSPGGSTLQGVLLYLPLLPEKSEALPVYVPSSACSSHPVLGGTTGGAGCCYLLPLPLPPHCSPSFFPKQLPAVPGQESWLTFLKIYF